MKAPSSLDSALANGFIRGAEDGVESTAVARVLCERASQTAGKTRSQGPRLHTLEPGAEGRRAAPMEPFFLRAKQGAPSLLQGLSLPTSNSKLRVCS